jgi:hypothetical protein
MRKAYARKKKEFEDAVGKAEILSDLLVKGVLRVE